MWKKNVSIHIVNLIIKSHISLTINISFTIFGKSINPTEGFFLYYSTFTYLIVLSGLCDDTDREKHE